MRALCVRNLYLKRRMCYVRDTRVHRTFLSIARECVCILHSTRIFVFLFYNSTLKINLNTLPLFS